jgi:hypothetical protein
LLSEFYLKDIDDAVLTPVLKARIKRIREADEQMSMSRQIEDLKIVDGAEAGI